MSMQQRRLNTMHNITKTATCAKEDAQVLCKHCGRGSYFLHRRFFVSSMNAKTCPMHSQHSESSHHRHCIQDVSAPLSNVQCMTIYLLFVYSSVLPCQCGVGERVQCKVYRSQSTHCMGKVLENQILRRISMKYETAVSTTITGLRSVDCVIRLL